MCGSLCIRTGAVEKVEQNGLGTAQSPVFFFGSLFVIGARKGRRKRSCDVPIDYAFFWV